MLANNDAINIFNHAVEVVKPSAIISKYIKIDGNILTIADKKLKLDGINKIYLLSVGKAAAAMALEAEKILGDNIANGLVVTKYHHALPLTHCNTIEAGHPVPDENGIKATAAIKKFLSSLTGNDLLLCLISGGASALIADMADGISLDDLQQLSKLLLNCGASIHEINTVRKHICVLKGGQLLRHTNGAQVISLLVSDVMGDDPGVIASGLTVADNSSFRDAWDVIDKFDLSLKIPISIKKYLQDGLRKHVMDTPKPGDSLFDKTANYIIVRNEDALNAAKEAATQLGYHVNIIDKTMKGEAKEMAATFVNALITYKGNKPACLLMGGETTVTINGNGKGGRNQEFVLAALIELMQLKVTVDQIPVILSGGTDGTDGPTDAAGAFIDKNVLNNIKALPYDPLLYLLNNDAYHFFQQTGTLLITGPTQTNVMDIVIGLIA